MGPRRPDNLECYFLKMMFFKTLDDMNVFFFFFFLFSVSSTALQKRQENVEALLERRDNFEAY